LARGWLEVVYIKATSSPYKASQTPLFSRFTLLFVIVATLVSSSRIFAVTRNYHAPMAIAAHFHGEELPHLLNTTGLLPQRHKVKPSWNTYVEEEQNQAIDLTPIKEFNLTLCYGKEWYRFPGHYLIPTGVNVEFIKSEFDGLLPRHFRPSVGIPLLEKASQTREIPSDLNDLNREELGHYVDVKSCHYLVDMDHPLQADPPKQSPEIIFARDTKTWERVFCAPFLDASRTPTLQRLLWLPGKSWRNRASWANYCLLKNTSKVAKALTETKKRVNHSSD